MANEFFAFPETRHLFDTLNEISRRSNVSRGRAFEDVLRATVAALAAETLEPMYFDAIEAHTAGEKGKRGVDLFPRFLAQAVEAMSNDDKDVLGDLFQGSVSYGEHGLYLTPQPVAELMANLTCDDSVNRQAPTICDPCCGTGILLMEAGKQNSNAELIGQDVDARCARIAAINLGLRGRYGWVICGNSLSRDVQFVYRIGSFFHDGPNGRRRGVVREVPPNQCPVLPEITATTRSNLHGHLQREGEPPTDQADQSGNIVEIPQWLLRIEQQSADTEEPAPGKSPERRDTARSPKGTEAELKDAGENPMKRQRGLFD